MANDNFNRPLMLINKKPNGTQMIDNGYAFYMYPSLVMEYANKVLTDRERRLYFAISGQAEKDKNGKPYYWAISHYCKIANIKSNHYAEILQGLCQKGFLIHNIFDSIEVLYPISENEILTQNGEIIKVHDSQNGKSASQNALKNGEEESQKGNQDSRFGNKDSLNCANNREIKINKEERESPINPKEKEYEEKISLLIRQIGRKFDIEDKVTQQLQDLKERGFTNEYIFTALDKKSIDSFSMGIGLLFTESYKKEIQREIDTRNKRIEEALKRAENIKPHIQETRKVKMPKVPSPKINIKTYGIEDFEW